MPSLLNDVLISGVEDVMYHRIVNHLVPVAHVHIKGVSTIEGSGLEGFNCIGLYNNCGSSTGLLLI